MRPFYGSAPGDPDWARAASKRAVPAHWVELVELLAAQNPLATAKPVLDSLQSGAGVVVTGQQVGLFGGPLFHAVQGCHCAGTRAASDDRREHAHAAIFWIASEDHDFAEINHVTFPSRKELRTLVYAEHAWGRRVPVGGVVLDESITPLIEEAWELLGYSDAMEALADSVQAGPHLRAGLCGVLREGFCRAGIARARRGRAAHFIAWARRCCARPLEGADDLHAALVERNKALEAAGYHAQVAVAPQSSLLFLIDEATGARLALKRMAPSAAEPGGLWQAGRGKYSTADLLGILDAEPERISPSALLRPVFQDFLLSTSLTIGGPAEIAYFAQSAVLFERILGRMTPVQPRFSATLVEPAIGELLRKHELTVERLFAGATVLFHLGMNELLRPIRLNWRSCWRRARCPSRASASWLRRAWRWMRSWTRCSNGCASWMRGWAGLRRRRRARCATR